MKIKVNGKKRYPRDKKIIKRKINEKITFTVKVEVLIIPVTIQICFVTGRIPIIASIFKRIGQNKASSCVSVEPHLRWNNRKRSSVLCFVTGRIPIIASIFTKTKCYRVYQLNHIKNEIIENEVLVLVNFFPLTTFWSVPFFTSRVVPWLSNTSMKNLVPVDIT